MKIVYKIFGVLLFGFWLFFSGSVQAADYQCCIIQPFNGNTPAGGELCVYTPPSDSLATGAYSNDCVNQGGDTISSYCTIYAYETAVGPDNGKLKCQTYSMGGDAGVGGKAIKQVDCLSQSACVAKIPGYSADAITWSGDFDVEVSAGETKSIVISAINSQDSNKGVDLKCTTCNVSGIVASGNVNNITLIISGALLEPGEYRMFLVGESGNFVSTKEVVIKKAGPDSAGTGGSASLSGITGPLGCYCKVDDVADKVIIPGINQSTCKSYASKTVSHEGKSLSDCEWNASGEQDVDSYKEKVLIDVSSLNVLGTTDVNKIIGRAIKTGMGIIGSIALAMFIYAGLLWMISGQNSEYASRARNLLVWTSLGLIVILGAYALVDFVFEAFR